MRTVSPAFLRAGAGMGQATPKQRAEFFQRLGAMCPVTTLQVGLMEAFRLSVQEVVDLEPAKADAGDRLVVHEPEGFRVVLIETARQRELLDAARAAADDKGLLRAVPGRDARQAARRLHLLVGLASARRSPAQAHVRYADRRPDGGAVLFTQQGCDR